MLTLEVNMRSTSCGAAAAMLALALGCAGCGMGVRHTAEMNPSARNNWKAVMRLRPGHHLDVMEFSGVSITGSLVSVEQNQLTISTPPRIVLRSNIQWILVDHSHFGETGAKMFGLGALIGGIAGAAIVPDHRVLGGAVLAAIFGVKAGFAGLVMGGVADDARDKVLVYYRDARRRASSTVQ
jgi:hypothetical protein